MTHSQTQGADGAGTKTAGQALWRCPECDCHSYARVDQKQPNGGYAPGPLIRCVNCKDVFHAPAAPAPATTSGVPDSVRALSEAVASAAAEQKKSSDLYNAAARRSERTFEDLTEVYETFECADKKLRQAKDALADHCLSLIAAQPAGQSEDAAERCIACAEPLKAGERVLSDASGGIIHAACCGPERESYTGANDEALGPNDPIPQGYVYEGEQLAGQERPDRKWVCNGDPAHPAGQSAGSGTGADAGLKDAIADIVSRAEKDQAFLRRTLARMREEPAPDSTRTGAAETEDFAAWLTREAKENREEAAQLASRGDYTAANHFNAKAAALDEAAAALATRPEAPSDAGWSQAARDVLAERRRQVEIEGWTAEHDDTHSRGEMACAAACYATELDLWTGYKQADRKGRATLISAKRVWPWSGWWKPTNRRRNLVKAGALILAEIERIDRSAQPSDPAPSGQAEG